MAEAGWLGIAMPEAYGGSGLGITEAAILMQAIAQSGAGFSGAHEHLRAAPGRRLWQ
jgi:acyl-CoA dehydrogenase